MTSYYGIASIHPLELCFVTGKTMHCLLWSKKYNRPKYFYYNKEEFEFGLEVGNIRFSWFVGLQLK